MCLGVETGGVEWRLVQSWQSFNVWSHGLRSLINSVGCTFMQLPKGILTRDRCHNGNYMDAACCSVRRTRLLVVVVSRSMHASGSKHTDALCYMISLPLHATVTHWRVFVLCALYSCVDRKRTWRHISCLSSVVTACSV